MSEPMTPERLADIRARVEKRSSWDRTNLTCIDMPALLNEVERLRADLAASRRTAAVFWDYIPEDLRKEVVKLITEVEAL